MSSVDIIVFGANGAIGNQVCRALAAKKVPFRAVVRDVEKAQSIKNLLDGVELAVADVTDLPSVEKALIGITKVFLLTPPTDKAGKTTLETGLPLVESLKKAGVKHIVKLSALGTEATYEQFNWGNEHRQLEDQISKVGIPLTSLRPSGFYTNMYRWNDSIKNESPVTIPIADSKINWICNEDIGAVAAKALIEGEPHYGKKYNLTGPDNMTWRAAAELIGKITNKKINIVSITVDQFKESAKQWMSPTSIDGFGNMLNYFEAGHYDKNYPDLENLLGYKGKPLAQYIEENKQIWM